MIEHFECGDVVQTRKPHPCGSNQWTIIRTGADVKIKCLKCARIVMLDRAEFVKCAAKIVEHKKTDPQ